MKPNSCPEEARLIEFVDEALPLESMQRIERHVRDCSSCVEAVQALRQLCADIRAPHAGVLDVPGHVEAVLARLDRPAAPQKSWQKPVWIALSGIAAALALFVLSRSPQHGEDEYAARGAKSQSSLARDVGLEPFAYEGTARRLASGSKVRADTPLGASYRNLGSSPAYLLLFVLDAKGEVHWLSPAYTQAGSDPAAVLLAPTEAPRTLDTTAVLADLAPGPLQVIALLSRQPRHVSNIEELAPRDRAPEALRRRFPECVVQTTPLEQSPSEAATP